MITFGDNIKMMVLIPICFIFFDVLTGILKAIKTKKVNTSISRDGLIKKCGWFVTILFGIFFYYACNTIVALCGIASVIIATESVSIIQNLEKIGVKVPFLLEICKNISQNNTLK